MRLRTLVVITVLALISGAVFLRISCLKPDKEAPKKLVPVGFNPTLVTIKGEIVSIEPEKEMVTIKAGLPARRRTIIVRKPAILSLKTGDLVVIKTEFRQSVAKSIEVVNDISEKKRGKPKLKAPVA